MSAAGAGPAYVAGATGYVGRALTMRLARAGDPVVAHVRPGSTAAGARDALAAAGAIIDRAAWTLEEMRSSLVRWRPSRLFILVGTTRRRSAAARRRGERAGYEEVDRDLPLLLIEAALSGGVRPTLVYLSALGADAQARNPYLRARGEVEVAARASPLSWVIARPSFVTGPDRTETRPAERWGAAAVDGVTRALAALGWRAPLERYGSLDAARMAAALDTLSLQRDALCRIVDGRLLREVSKAP
ncbi:MAG: NAD(P)H-binding protein [Gemmatimonadota bacterium]